MVKVADMLPDDPSGPLLVDPRIAEQRAGYMRWLLEMNMGESDRIEAVRTCHNALGYELELAVWHYLNSKERALWKAYLELAARNDNERTHDRRD